MLRIIQSKSAEQAKGYYVGSLSREDYYSEGQEITGNWGGRAAELLGLQGAVTQDGFFDLCDNLHPATGEALTPRTKDERTVGYDFNFHVPKSVSAMYAVTLDENLITTLRAAVDETMREMEKEMKTRVRMNGAQSERVTGNMLWSEFVHKTARPVDGKPDPHLHVHCFVMNVTHDEIEDRFKAGYFRDLKRDAPYYEAVFHSHLAAKVEELGYRTVPKGRFWEIDGVPQSVVDKFSRRRDQIEALAEELGITDAREKDKLGATSREKKVNLSLETLAGEWVSRLTPEELTAMEAARDGSERKREKAAEKLTPQMAVDHAVSHVFERSSVASEKDVLEEALRFGVGRLTAHEIKEAFGNDPRLIRRTIEGERLCTTWEVRDQEKKIVEFARETRGVLDPIKPGPHVFADTRLNVQQREAVEHVLSSRDQVTMIRGGAGVGKTTLMREAIGAINRAGYEVLPLAPTADASRSVLRGEGLAKANTVESFLNDEAMQRKMGGQVIWVDEAGLLSANTTERLFDAAKTNACRVIFSGDTAQHHAVERGDVMRILEKHAGLPLLNVQDIIRQRDQYKKVIEAIRDNKLTEAFATLEKIDAIREHPDVGTLHKQLAEEYVSLQKQQKSVLIVSPQHQEINAVTKAVREKLREEGKIRGEEHSATKLTNLQLTTAQRADPRNFETGRVVQFLQNAPGFRKGERLSVIRSDGETVTVRDAAGEAKPLPLGLSKHYQLYIEEQMKVAAGDRVRITQNRFARTGERLDNGSLHEVAAVDRNGDIRLTNGAVLPKDFGHLTHGYCVTSYVSQSKTVNVPLIAQSSLSFNASSLEQIYVSLSRGKDGLRIFTDDLKELRARVAKSTARESALDFLGDIPEERRSRTMPDLPVEMRRAWRSWERRKEKEITRLYERGLQSPREMSKGRKERGHGLEISVGL